MDIKKTVTGILLLVFLMGTLLLPSYGSDLDQMKKDQSKIRHDINRTEKELQNTKKEQKAIFDQLNNIDSGIEKTTAELENIKGKILKAEEAIELTQRELDEAQARLDERIGILSARLKDMYQEGDVSYLEVLLDASDFRDFLVRLHLLEKIAEQDMVIVDEIEAERKKIENKKADLEARRQELASLERETKYKRNELEIQKDDKQDIMVALETEKATIEKALTELEQNSNAIAARIRSAQARNQPKQQNQGSRLEGKFTWPTPGNSRITSDYGMRLHPTLGVNKLHTGIDIGASSGTGVCSAESGVVIFSGWLGAYGNAIVVDHGGGLSTLYGHLSSIGVSEGRSVSRGQQIGRVGSTGWSTGPHLHFEVRVNGEPVNPWGYVR